MADVKEEYCVYILSCADDSFYTGMTCDLKRRLREHRAGRGAQWTSRRLPVELVFSRGNLAYRSARKVEQYIKSLSRARKKALIAHEPGTMTLVGKRIQ
ncbi:MAG: GIY-YIG nuclease family protein [Chloroflexota bacterium]|nr:GIY-YIG nuclease family protein [Chloroflexota bacterium]